MHPHVARARLERRRSVQLGQGPWFRGVLALWTGAEEGAFELVAPAESFELEARVGGVEGVLAGAHDLADPAGLRARVEGPLGGPEATVAVWLHRRPDLMVRCALGSVVGSLTALLAGDGEGLRLLAEDRGAGVELELDWSRPERPRVLVRTWGRDGEPAPPTGHAVHAGHAVDREPGLEPLPTPSTDSGPALEPDPAAGSSTPPPDPSRSPAASRAERLRIARRRNLRNRDGGRFLARVAAVCGEPVGRFEATSLEDSFRIDAASGRPVGTWSEVFRLPERAGLTRALRERLAGVEGRVVVQLAHTPELPFACDASVFAEHSPSWLALDGDGVSALDAGLGSGLRIDLHEADAGGACELELDGWGRFAGDPPPASTRPYRQLVRRLDDDDDDGDEDFATLLRRVAEALRAPWAAITDVDVAGEVRPLLLVAQDEVRVLPVAELVARFERVEHADWASVFLCGSKAEAGSISASGSYARELERARVLLRVVDGGYYYVYGPVERLAFLEAGPWTERRTCAVDELDFPE